MARTSYNDYGPYLDDVLTLWDELGADFTVGKLARADVVKLRDDLRAVLARIDTLNTQMGLQMGVRDTMIEDDDTGVEAFAVKFKAAVVAGFGARSPQAGRVPRLVVRKSRAKKPDDSAAATPPQTPAA